MKRVLCALLCTAVLACASHHRPDTIPAGDGPLVGVYKVTIDEGRGTVRHTRVSVWAARPDRLHAELHGPIGGVSFVLDAGGGKTCIVHAAAATAYVGRDAPGSIESLLHVRVSAAGAVAALLDGDSRDGLTVTRRGAADRSLPDWIRIADGRRSITLTRVGFVRGNADPASLGTGAPPSGLVVLPIESLKSAAEGEPERNRAHR